MNLLKENNLRFGIFLLCFTLMVIQSVTRAQQTQEAGLPFISNYEPSDYGADPINWSIIQDDRGIIYAANTRGLLEYDGSSWRLITMENSAGVRCFAKDKNGRIYLGGNNLIGYLTIDSVGQTIFVSIKDQLPEEEQELSEVWDIHIMDGDIYLNMHTKLIRINDQGIKVWHSSSGFHMSKMVHGKLYLREWDRGMIRLDGDEIVMLPGGEIFASERIYHILPYDENKVLLGTVTQGLFLFDGVKFSPFPTEADAILKTYQPYLPGVVLPDGNFALGTIGGGCLIIDKKGHLIQQIDRKSGLQDGAVLYTYIDKEGALWLGLSKGIARVDISSPITFFSEKMGLESSVFDVQRHHGTLYVGTTSGASYLDPGLHQFVPIDGIGIQCFDIASVEDQLLAVSYLGLAEIRNKAALPVRASVNRDYVAYGIVRSKANPRRIIIGLGEKIGTLYKSDNGKWIDEGFIPGLEEFSTNYGVETEEGILWSGTQENGIIRMKFKDPSIGPRKQEVEITLFGQKEGLPPGPTDVFEIHGGIYFFTRNGIFSYDQNSGKFLPSAVFQEISDITKNQRTLAIEDNDKVWIAGSELVLGEKQPDGTYQFIKKPFFPLTDFNINWIYPEENGIVWIATAEGLVRYDANKQKDYSLEYISLIRRVETGEGTLLSAGRTEFGIINRLPYDDNSVNFQFTATSFENEEKMEYQTFLEGFDDDYSLWSRKKDREYTNLHEGKYTFKVRARNIYGVETDEASFSFEVQPPFYRTWWAYLGYIIMVGGFIWLIVRSRTRQLKSQREALEKTVADRTRELRQRVEELAVINSVQQGLVAEMDLNAIYNMVGDKIRDIFDAQIVSIATFNYNNHTEQFHFLFEEGAKHYPEARPIDILRTHLIETKKPFVANEPNDKALIDLGIVNPKPVPGTKMPLTAVFMPMIVGEKVRGYISLQNIDRTFAFSESDISLLGTLTNSMSVALENARLFNETQQRAAEMATVTNVSNALASQLDLDTLIHMVGEQMKDLFKANIVFVALLDKKTNIINFPYQYGDDIEPIQYGEGLTSRIIRTGKAALINQDVNAHYDELGIARKGKEAASFLGVPIQTGKEVIGVVSVQSTEQENRFNEDDKRLLMTIASNVGVAIHNAKLFDETLKAQAEAEEARKIAEEANEAKSAFLSTVSHELRTPLTSVIGFAKIIRKRLSDKIFPLIDISDPKAKKTMDQISQNLDVVVSEGERLTTLINDVLDLAKIEAGKMEWHMETIDMQKVIDQALAATAAVFETKKLKLKRSVSKELSSVQGDRDKLIQVLINLLSNAAKFTDKGSVTCAAKRSDDSILISVSDTGMGISENDQSKVFDKFKQVGDTLTDKPKGTGLGLPICKEIIEYHGGRIWVESVLGKGSTFFFTIPLKRQEGHAIDLDDLVRQLKKQVLDTAPNSVERAQTILVADDEAHIRNLLRQELMDSGYNILEASNGKEAIEVVRQSHPDLLILDVMMPEMNGFDVAAVLKNDPQTMDIPILILSIIQDKDRGFRLGVDRYLTKPIDTDNLFKEVGDLLEQGKSKRRVMVVDENESTVRTLAEVLQARGYQVVESNGVELIKKAIDSKPDIIILNSVLSNDQEMIRTLRFEKGLENVLFLMYQ